MQFKIVSFLIAVCIVSIANAQKTYVPDDNFEQQLINLGYDTVLDDSVLTASIDTVIILTVGVNSMFVYDLTGIEDFTSLKSLNCSYNELTTLDLSNNLALESLYCFDNELTNLNVSNNLALTELACGINDIANLDVSNNIMLETLRCGSNDITTLDLSNNENLEQLSIYHNELEDLNLSNGNNSALTSLNTENNPNLTCIQVDNANYSTTNWVGTSFSFDANTGFSEDCNSSVGVFEQNANALDLYPNPTTGIVNILGEHNGFYTIYSVLGKNMLQSGLLTPGLTTLDISALDKGIYILKTTSEEGLTTMRRIVKQ